MLNLKRKSLKLAQDVGFGLLFVFGIIVALIVLYITYIIIFVGMTPILEIGFFSFLGSTWQPETGQYGILLLFLGSIYCVGGGSLLAIIPAFFAALFITKEAPYGLAKLITQLLTFFSSIPAVVYGLVGYTLLGPFISSVAGLPKRQSLLLVVIVLALIILPRMTQNFCRALTLVPPEQERASIALGATQTETWLRVSIRYAGPQLLVGFLLSLGRIMSEALVVLMLAGNIPNIPSIKESVATLGSVISGGGAGDGTSLYILFSLGLVIFCIVFILKCIHNILTKWGNRG